MEKNEIERNATAAKLKVEAAIDIKAADQTWLDSRMASARMNRCLTIIQNELEEEKRLKEKTDHAALFNEQVRREIALAKAVEQEKQRESAEIARRVHLREQIPELRDLLQKISTGYLCRDLKNQIAYNEYRKRKEKLEDLEADRMLGSAIYTDKEYYEQEEREKMLHIMAYREQILNQVRETEEAAKMENQQQIEIEKKEMENILKKAADEEEREKQIKNEKKLQLAEEAAQCIKEREEELKRLAREKLALEQMIEAQRKAIESKQSFEKAERQRLQRLKDESNMKIAMKTKAEKDKQEELANMYRELDFEENIEKLLQDDLREKMKIANDKKNNCEALLKQMQEKEKDREREKKDEDRVKEMIDKELEKANAKEAEKVRMKKQKQKEYAEELRQQIEENQIKRKLDKQDEDNRAAAVEDKHEDRDKEIEKEREQIIRSHIPAVMRCLGRGTLKYEDVPILQQLAEEYESVQGINYENIFKRREEQQFSKCNEQCLRLREY